MKMKIDKNTKYALYFGGALVATYIVVKLMNNAKPKTPLTPEKKVVYTDKYLATLPLGVDDLTWGSNVPTKYLPSFDASANALSDPAFKAKVTRVQRLLNERIATFAGGFPRIVEDGIAGKETTKAMLVVASKYGKMNLLPLTQKSDIDKWLTFFNVKDATDTTKTKELPWWG
jgi:hypothetical protein